jgi:hypothetical protein
MANAPRSLPRVVAAAAAQAVVSGAWIAARELSPAKRRLARLSTVAAVAAVGWATSDDTEAPGSETDDDTPSPEFDRRKAAALGVAALAGTAAILGRRRLEKRWLARLTRDGHTHPTRALALRMSAVEFTLHLGLQLADRHRKG